MIAKPFRLALVWLALVLVLGTGYFGPKQTQQSVVPALRVLMPGMPGSVLQTLHAAIRKLSHVTEYAVLALLWVRAFRWKQRLGLTAASWAALAVCVGCAVIDEVHQSIVPGRHGGMGDVVLDALGAAAMLIVVWFRTQLADAPIRDSQTILAGVRLDEGA
jgi:VanZ family protein